MAEKAQAEPDEDNDLAHNKTSHVTPLEQSW